MTVTIEDFRLTNACKKAQELAAKLKRSALVAKTGNSSFDAFDPWEPLPAGAVPKFYVKLDGSRVRCRK